LVEKLFLLVSTGGNRLFLATISNKNFLSVPLIEHSLMCNFETTLEFKSRHLHILCTQQILVADSEDVPLYHAAITIIHSVDLTF